jgi:CheY-like chemotaxis protein
VTPKLLLADDSVTIQRVIELTFADEDVQVFAVGDGQQAIERVQAEPPDIVLADVGMPERDGYEVAAFIKGDPALAHIPVLLLTGAFEPIDEVRARAVGCDGVLVKPFEPQMVISRVRDLLSGKRDGEPGGHRTGLAVHAKADANQAASGEVSAAATESGGPSLEDYFDRLDAALASKGMPPPQIVPLSPQAPTPRAAGPPVLSRPTPAAAQAETAAAPASPIHKDFDLTGWDPSATTEPAARAPITSPVAAAVSATGPTAPKSSAAAAPRPPSPSMSPASAPETLPWQPATLQDAFSALLATEQGQSSALPPPAPAVHAPTPEMIEEITRRVIAKMGDESMRAAVLDVAERLVREEIARIKSQN